MEPNKLMLNSFIQYANERQNVFTRRQEGLPQEEWTDDPILKVRSFCNNYRFLDYGSQYFIREILADFPDKHTTLLRAALYRMTNQPSFWEYMYQQLGGMPTLEDVEDGSVGEVMEMAYQGKRQIFRPAYRVFFTNNKDGAGKLKHQTANGYFQRYFLPDGENSVVPRFDAADTMYARICALEGAFRVGPFMAQQMVTDVNYSEHFLGGENDRVVLGPGSLSGLRHIYGMDVIPGGNFHHVNGEIKIQDLQEHLSHIRLELPGGKTRGLSMLDVQNVLCEFSKYVKYSQEFGEDKGKVFPARSKPPVLAYPEHWL